MSARGSFPLVWHRLRPGDHMAIDDVGNGWYAQQETSHRWNLYCNGVLVDECGSLSEAKFSAAVEVRRDREGTRV